jgi:hypothetical protein
MRHEGKNIFVAECKLWRGPKAHLEALDQLLSYLTWIQKQQPHEDCRRPVYGEWLCGAGQGCRGRILKRLYIDNCLPLTVELFHQLAFSF